MKRFVVLFVCLLCIVGLFACIKDDDIQNPDTKNISITLNEDDIAMLNTIKDDIHYINDEDFYNTINDFNIKASELKGNLYQLEGIFTYRSIHGVNTPYLFKYVLTNEKEVIQVGILLNNMNNYPNDGDWIKVTGVLTNMNHDNHSHVALDIILLETIEKHGVDTIIEE